MREFNSMSLDVYRELELYKAAPVINKLAVLGSGDELVMRFEDLQHREYSQKASGPKLN